MFSKAVRFSLAIVFWLSATKTTPSAPARTTRRVALYCTWPGYRVELDLEVVAGDASQAEREEVEEEGPVLGGVEGDQPVRALGVGDPVDLLEVRRLPGLGRTVVDDLGLDGPFAEVELDHDRLATIPSLGAWPRPAGAS